MRPSEERDPSYYDSAIEELTLPTGEAPVEEAAQKTRNRKKKRGPKAKRKAKWWDKKFTRIRYCPQLRRTWKLTVAESMLAHFFVAYSSIRLSKKHSQRTLKLCGGQAVIPARLIAGAISSTVLRKINVYLNNLVEKGVLSRFVGRKGNFVIATVTGKFARAVRRSTFYIRDLAVWEYNWGKNSPMYKATATAKLMIYAWDWCIKMFTKYGIYPKGLDLPNMGHSSADQFPRTRMLSKWMGISPAQVRRLREKYNGVLWEVQDVWRRDEASNPDAYRDFIWGTASIIEHREPFQDIGYAVYGRCIKKLKLECYKYVGHRQLIHMTECILDSYETKLKRMRSEFGINWMKQGYAYCSQHAERIQRWHDWIEALTDNPAVGYRMYKKRVTMAYERWMDAWPEFPSNPIYETAEETTVY